MPPAGFQHTFYVTAALPPQSIITAGTQGVDYYVSPEASACRRRLFIAVDDEDISAMRAWLALPRAILSGLGFSITSRQILRFLFRKAARGYRLLPISR